jgi:signal peptidase I
MTQRWIAAVVIGVAVLLLATLIVGRLVIFDLFHNPSQAMFPSIPEGSLMLVDRRNFAPLTRWGIDPFNSKVTAAVEYADVLIFRRPQNDGQFYVKRVVGLPGDHVEYRDNQLSVNGKRVALVLQRSDDRYQFATEQLGTVAVHVALDQRSPAIDVDVRVPADHFLMLGDNRNNSLDSRMFGAVPRANLVGRVIKVWSR